MFYSMIHNLFLSAELVVLIFISVKDWNKRIIQNRYILVLFLLTMTGHLMDVSVEEVEIWPVSLQAGLRACAVMLILMILFSFLMRKIIRRFPFGGGDIKLLCTGAFALGLVRTVIAFDIAVLLSAGVLLFRIIRKEQARSFHQALPFGPMLCAGLCISCLAGSRIIAWYISA